MQYRVRVFATVTFLVARVASVQGQAPVTGSPVDSGKAVRMHTATGIITGRLTARFHQTDDTLRYCRYPGPPCLGTEDSVAMRTIAAATLQRLEVSPGSHWRRGAVIGGVFGAIMGGVSTAFLISFCEGSECGSKRSRDLAVVLGGLSGGLTFGALGALWGSAFPRWHTNP